MINLLFISGSLRKQSSNRNILLALAELAPANVNCRFYEDLEEIPPFNPDKEEGNDSVRTWRTLVKEADGVVICTPEYAFGVPGALKNALDWLVSSGELNDKPVAAISASPLVTGGDKALASLLLTLKALGTKMTVPGSDSPNALSLPAISKKNNEKGQLTDTPSRERLKALIGKLLSLVHLPPVA